MAAETCQCKRLIIPLVHSINVYAALNELPNIDQVASVRFSISSAILSCSESYLRQHSQSSLNSGEVSIGHASASNSCSGPPDVEESPRISASQSTSSELAILWSEYEAFGRTT